MARIKDKAEAERLAMWLQTPRGKAAHQVLQGWMGWQHSVLTAMAAPNFNSWTAEEEVRAEELLRWLPTWNLTRSGWEDFSPERRNVENLAHATRIAIAVGLLAYHPADVLLERLFLLEAFNLQQEHFENCGDSCPHDLTATVDGMRDAMRKRACIAGEAVRQELLSR